MRRIEGNNKLSGNNNKNEIKGNKPNSEKVEN